MCVPWEPAASRQKPPRNKETRLLERWVARVNKDGVILAGVAWSPAKCSCLKRLRIIATVLYQKLNYWTGRSSRTKKNDERVSPAV